MKQLKSAESNKYSLEVVECDCGFHLGIDSTWLEQSSNSAGFELPCPACNSPIPVDQLTKPKTALQFIYPKGECPDCFEPIPNNKRNGDSCDNCDHVFISQATIR